MLLISSKDNEKIKHALHLASSGSFRKNERMFLAEGVKICCDLSSTCRTYRLFCTQKALEQHPELEKIGGDQCLISEGIADKLSEGKASQGVFGVFYIPEYDSGIFSSGKKYLALEGVQDPGNVGALIRSAVAFSFDAVILGPGCASPYAPKTIRASVGAVCAVPVVFSEDLQETIHLLKSKDILCFAAALYNSVPLSKVDTKNSDGICVVIGSEGSGLKEQTIVACNQAVRIPISEKIESLNAAVAGSVLLWHFRGQS